MYCKIGRVSARYGDDTTSSVDVEVVLVPRVEHLLARLLVERDVHRVEVVGPQRLRVGERLEHSHVHPRRTSTTTVCTISGSGVPGGHASARSTRR